MKLEELITYWELKDMVAERHLVSENIVRSWRSEGKKNQCQRIFRIRVKEPSKYAWRWADILYRDTFGKIALVHADCFSSGGGGAPEIYIPCAKLKDLIEEFK